MIKARAQIDQLARHHAAIGVEAWQGLHFVDADNGDFRCIDDRCGDQAAYRSQQGDGDGDGRAGQFALVALPSRATVERRLSSAALAKLFGNRSLDRNNPQIENQSTRHDRDHKKETEQ